MEIFGKLQCVTSKNCIDFSDDSSHIVLGSMLGYGCIGGGLECCCLIVIYFSKEQSWLSG